MKLDEQILEILNGSKGHMTAEDVYLYCANNKIKGSMASVYRVLSKLSDNGVIRKVSIPGHPDIFDKTPHEHEHLFCVKCGKVKDLKIDGLKESILKKVGNGFQSYDLCVKYVCEDCLKNSN